MDFIEAIFRMFISFFQFPLWVYGIVGPALLLFGWWAAKEFWDGIGVAIITFVAGAAGISFLAAVFPPAFCFYGG